MKKIILGFALALLMFGCSDDNEGISISKDELVGKWIWVSTESKVDFLGQGSSTIQEADDFNFESYVVFYQDGSYEASGDMFVDEISYSEEITTGSYEIDGDNIIVTVEGVSISSESVIENGNRLIMSYDKGVVGMKVEVETIYIKE